MSTVTLVMAGHEFIVSGAGLRVEVVELAGKRVIAPNEPAAAVETAGDYLREPAATASGQIIREGDAPRETDCQPGEQSQGGSDASGPDAEFANALKALVNDEPSPEAGPQAEAFLVGTDTGTPADREGRIDGEAASVGLPTHVESEPLAPPPAGDREAGSELLPASGHPNIGPADSAVPGGEPSIPTEDERRAGPSRDAGHNRQSSEAVTNSKPRKPLRPHCQRPTLCGGYGDKHCGTCLKQAGIAA